MEGGGGSMEPQEQMNETGLEWEFSTKPQGDIVRGNTNVDNGIGLRGWANRVQAVCTSDHYRTSRGLHLDSAIMACGKASRSNPTERVILVSRRSGRAVRKPCKWTTGRSVRAAAR